MCSLYRLLLTLSIEKQKCCAANTLSVGVRGIEHSFGIIGALATFFDTDVIDSNRVTLGWSYGPTESWGRRRRGQVLCSCVGER